MWSEHVDLIDEEGRAKISKTGQPFWVRPGRPPKKWVESRLSSPKDD